MSLLRRRHCENISPVPDSACVNKTADCFPQMTTDRMQLVFSGAIQCPDQLDFRSVDTNAVPNLFRKSSDF